MAAAVEMFARLAVGFNAGGWISLGKVAASIARGVYKIITLES